MKIGSMDLNGVPILNKDFGGNKFGPNKRTFSTIIADPELQERLLKDGVNLYFPPKAPGSVEPPVAYMTVTVDNRYNDVELTGVFPNGAVCKYNDYNYHDLDDLWIKSADMFIILNSWEKNGRSGVTPYLKLGVIYIMSDEEKAAITENKPDDAEVKRFKDRYPNFF